MEDDRRAGERRADYVKPDLNAPYPTHDALIAGLASASLGLSTTGQSLLTAAERILSALATTRTQRLVAMSLLVLNALAALAIVIGTGVLIHIGTTNRTNTQLIRDCTEPDGSCYQRNQQSQAAAIAILQRYTLIAVECAHVGTDQQVEACVLTKSHEQGLVK